MLQAALLPAADLDVGVRIGGAVLVGGARLAERRLLALAGVAREVAAAERVRNVPLQPPAALAVGGLGAARLKRGEVEGRVLAAGRFAFAAVAFLAVVVVVLRLALPM